MAILYDLLVTGENGFALKGIDKVNKGWWVYLCLGHFLTIQSFRVELYTTTWGSFKGGNREAFTLAIVSLLLERPCVDHLEDFATRLASLFSLHWRNILIQHWVYIINFCSMHIKQCYSHSIDIGHPFTCNSYSISVLHEAMPTAQPMQFQPCCARLVKDVWCRSYNGTLTLLRAHLPTCLPAGSLVQRSVERVTLEGIPLDFVCDAVGFFEHLKELKCTQIRAPQQVCLAL